MGLSHPEIYKWFNPVPMFKEFVINRGTLPSLVMIDHLGERYLPLQQLLMEANAKGYSLPKIVSLLDDLEIKMPSGLKLVLSQASRNLEIYGPEKKPRLEARIEEIT